MENPYQLDASKIEEPPSSFKDMLKHLGPGFILSASIVGSGELIATTALGAEAGFVAMWVILASCLVKVFVQLEFGKHAIHSGETTFEALNQLPGPKFGKGRWTTWLWLVLMSIKPLQVGGIIGGVHWGLAAIEAMDLVFVPISDKEIVGFPAPGEPTPGLYALDLPTGEQRWHYTRESRCPEEESTSRHRMD